MKSFIVDYDLNKEGAAYSAAARKVIDAIQSAGLGKSLKLMRTCWHVPWGGTAEALRDYIIKYGQMDSNDAILVNSTTGEMAWKLESVATSNALKAAC